MNNYYYFSPDIIIVPDYFLWLSCFILLKIKKIILSIIFHSYGFLVYKEKIKIKFLINFFL
jgi:hypothetical protein